jgi:DNA-binding NtrC family response regulator
VKRAIDVAAVPDDRPTTSMARPVVLVLAARNPRPELHDRLERLGYSAIVTGDTREALRRLADTPCDVCVIDLAGDRAALTSIRLLRARNATLPIVGLIDHGEPAIAADAVRRGVADLLTWPFDDGDVGAVMADVRDRAARPVSADEPPALVAHSAAMRDVLKRLRERASTDAICLCGAAGTGKGLLAQRLHGASARRQRACVVVDVDGGGVALPDLERALFGAEGALSLAGAARRGPRWLSPESALARASGGTLVLRHMGAMPPVLQRSLATLLRGGTATGDPAGRIDGLDVRLVGTFEGRAADALGDGLQPELARIFSACIDVPALSAREDDLPHLAAQLLARRQAAGSGTSQLLSRAALVLLAALPWPGNGDELERTIGVLAMDQPSNRPVIEIDDVLKVVRLASAGPVRSGGSVAPVEPVLSLRAARMQFERACIADALARHQGSVAATARALGIQRTNLYRKVRQLGLARAATSRFAGPP